MPFFTSFVLSACSWTAHISLSVSRFLVSTHLLSITATSFDLASPLFLSRYDHVMLSLSTLPVFNSFILLYSSHLSLVLVVSLQLKPSEVSRCCFQHFNKAVFCITTILYVIYSLSIHISKSFVTLSRAPITTGTTSTVLSLHNLPISIFKSWDFSTFSFSLSPALMSAATAISTIIPFRSFLSVTIMFVFLPLSLSHTEH